MLSTYDLIGLLAVRNLAHAVEFHAGKRPWFESSDVLSLLQHPGGAA